uniref:Protein painting of fourth n=1 Tax=Lygus hesperus TaxID=30085 RepID=A0A146M5M8_LYGHE
MVGPASGAPQGTSGPMSGQPPPNPGQLPFPPGMDPNQWGWNRPRAPGLRPGAFMQGPRRGPYMRPGFFPGPRGPPPQHHPGFNQRKPRPNWMPRLVRLPHSHFPSAPNDPNFIVNYQQPTNWTAQTPAATPAPTGSGEEDSSQQGEPSHPPKKKKRTTNGTSRPWDREAAELALKTEMEFKKNAGAHALVVRFPDPELSKDIIQQYNSAIENVHFQGPCSPRYCFVTLREGANVDQVMAELNEVKFGSGLLKAERKVEKQEENVKPEDIDPFTLFIGNLPANISTVQVKEKFPTALRIDVGYAQKMKYTRYAFARYSTTQAALEAYKQSINTIIASRSIVLRFRRNNAPVGPPGEKPAVAAVEAKPGEKLTVGAKLKAKRDKAKQEKAQRDREQGRYTYDDDDDSDEDKVSLEDDDSDSADMNNDGDEDVDDDEDDGEGEFEDDDDDDEEGEKKIIFGTSLSILKLVYFRAVYFQNGSFQSLYFT